MSYRESSGSVHGGGRTEVPVSAGSGSSGPFYKASRRLAVIFVTLAVAVFALTSVSLLLILRNDLQRGVGEREGEGDRAAVQRVNQTLRYTLPLLDVAGVIVLTGLGYWYARRTLRPLRESYEAQKRFIANASHELRTPLAIMRGEFELAVRGTGGSREALESGIEEVDRISGIVDDLVTLSRIDARQETLQFAPVDLATLVGEGVAKMASFAHLHDVVLRSDLEPEITVRADGPVLQRAVYNVLKNAVEHSGAGAEVTVTLRRAGTHAVITVTDTGRGMTQAELERAFEVFQRGDEVRGEGHSGGLGLPIARRIVEAHRGDIAVQSRPGVGTTATMRLPIS